MTSNAIELTIITTALAIFILVVGIVIVILIAHRSQLKQQVDIVNMKLGYEKELNTVSYEISETILTNLSREIHDNLGQQLTYLYLQLENLELEQPPLENDLISIKQTVVGATKELRSLSHSLNGDFVQTKGFLKAFLSEMGRLQQLKKPIFSLNCTEGPIPLDGNQQLIAFRIFQEMINNAMRHSAASNITVTLIAGNNFLLECRDDGKGFDQQKMTSSGSGLANMQKRAALAGMSLDIDSAPGKGSCFRLADKAVV